ncbi:MAG TPA: RHS repeat-associated core domain-containing protein, partial [Mogibacterium sp.]|nr:RHS repeat-associated core domain-containing protein [Mogibacterium sp.]
MGQRPETETDPAGNVVRISDIGLGHPGGRRIEVTLEYDALGNLKKEINANGTKLYSYDSMNNMTECVFNTTAGETTSTEKSTYTYDRFGMMTSRKDYIGNDLEREAFFEYDSLKRLIKYYRGEPVNSGEQPDWIQYGYDIDGNLTDIQYPNFLHIDNVSYTYDSYNRVTSVKMKSGGSNNEKLVREYKYKPDNRVSEVKDYSSNNHHVRKTFDYDDLGRCTSIEAYDSNGNRKIESFKYTYDKCNNITSEEKMHASDASGTGGGDNTGEESEDPDPENLDEPSKYIAHDGSYNIRRDYTYNELSEMTKVLEYAVSGDGETALDELLHQTEYTYDKIGSRKSEKIDGVKSIYTYDEDGLNQLTKVTVEGDSNNAKTKIYDYDDAGNLILLKDNEAGTEIAYTYNVAGELLSAKVRNTGTGEVLTTTNTYDGSGTRIAKIVTKKNAGGDIMSFDTTNYLVSGGSVLATYSEEENSSTGNSMIISSENIYGLDGNIIVTLRGNDDTRYIYTGDLRGSTASIIDDAGNSSCVYYYDVYGEPEIWKQDGLYNEIMYTGVVYDESTGLLYLSSRYYDAQSGRFISMDSYRGEIGNPLSLNLYGYCEGNP